MKEKNMQFVINLKRQALKLVMVGVMAITMLGIYTGVAYGEADNVRATTTPQKIESPAVIFCGADVNKGDGFQNSFEYLTKVQLENINSNEAAKEFFSSSKFKVYEKDANYSGIRKGNEWYLKTVSGLNLRGVADSLGVDVLKNKKIITISTDGYGGALISPFTYNRYCYETRKDQEGKVVDPMLGLTCTGIASNKEMPKLMFGQMNPNDFNMQNWAKNVKRISFGDPETALTANVKGSVNSVEKWNIAQVLETPSGLYKTQFTYGDSINQTVAKVEGVPLNRLLSDKKLKVKTVTIKLNEGKIKKTIPASDLSKYFVATNGTMHIGESKENPIKGTTSLKLYGPETKGEAFESIDILSAEDKPAAPTSVKAKAIGYNQIKISWGKVKGASGYSIDQYDGSTKKWSKEKYVEDGGNRSWYIAKNLKTGTKYSYRVKAYKYVGNLDITGDYKTTVSATPRLSCSAIIKGSKVGSSSLKITWKKIPGASGYVIYKGTSKGGKYTLVTTAKKGSTSTYTDKNVKKGKTYYYKVGAYRAFGKTKVYGKLSDAKGIRR